MQLYVLDKNPERSAEILYNAMGGKYCFKLAIEGMQLICSAGLSKVYKPIPQGKVFQNWLKNYMPAREWVYCNLSHLLFLSSADVNISDDTIIKTDKILTDLDNSISFECDEFVYALFRYKDGYKCNIPSDSILIIDDCIKEYKKYLEWKVKNN